MEIDSFFKIAQQYVSEVPLIVLGSGSSVPFGIPTMGQLANELEERLSYKDSDDIDKWKLFLNELEETKDLEKALHNTTLNEKISKDIIKTTWEFICEADKKAFESIHNNPKQLKLIDLLKYFEKSAKKRTSIVTTNYDRIAEYAVSYTNSLCYTGFTFNHIGHHISELVDAKFQELRDYSSVIKIWKIHGSLDWFIDHTGDTLSFPHSSSIPPGYVPCIVTPGIEKYRKTYNEPFRSIMTSIDKDFNNALSFFCIGYGFNDEHVQTYLLKKAQKDNIPIVLITKQISSKAKKLIIGGEVAKYLLIEESTADNSLVYTPEFNDGVVIEGDFWSLNGFLKILNPK